MHAPQLDVQGALAHTLRQISAVVVRMQEAPQADRLRYCYWAGRWHLLEHRIGVVSSPQTRMQTSDLCHLQAYPFLKQAFDICPNRLMKHKRYSYFVFRCYFLIYGSQIYISAITWSRYPIGGIPASNPLAGIRLPYIFSTYHQGSKIC